MAAPGHPRDTRPLAQEVLDQAGRLRAARQGFEPDWQDIRDHILPLAGAVTRRETPGARTSHKDKILDNTGEQAQEMLAAAVVGGLTPAHQDWLGLRARDERVNRDSESAAWLDSAAEIMSAVFRSPEAGFATTQHQKITGTVAMGTGVGFIGARPGRGIRFANLPLRKALLGEDGDGRVDTVCRDFTLTARQALRRWGEDAVGSALARAATSAADRDREFQFVHAVYPREDRDARALGRRHLPIASAYVCADEQIVVDEGGFPEMPFVTPRWDKRDDEVYGRGPGHKALSDVRMLQRAMRTQIRGVEKMVDPPLMVADDGILSPVRTGASAITHYRAGSWSMDPIKPLLTGGRPDLGEAFMDGVRGRIDAAFYKHLVLMIRNDRMTATEVLKVAEETQRILGPFLARLQAEDLGPTIVRVFGILLRAGAFPPLPRALRGQAIDIEYVSPLAKAQRLARARGLSQFSEIAAPLIQLDPAVVDNLDMDRAFRDTHDALGLPKDWLRPERAVADMRAARRQVQEQAAEAEQTMAATDTAANAVRALPALRQALGGGMANAA